MFRISRLRCKNGQNGIIHNLFARQSTAAATKKSTDSPSGTQRIVIPKKIDRGPTDLLYTLSKTVGRDPTAAHYKYQDDPYLIPTSLYNREQFALSQESGKQTAKWIKQEHAKLFNVSAFIDRLIKRSSSSIEIYSIFNRLNFFFSQKMHSPRSKHSSRNQSIAMRVK